MNSQTTIVLTACLFIIACRSASVKNPHPAGTQPQSALYIPKDLEDSFAQLESLLKQEEIEKIRSGTDDRMIDYQFGLGLWMRNNWGLWSGSRLAKWFNGIGIHHPDDMSAIILTSFWRYLHGVPIKLDEQVRHYQDIWNRIKK
jgi:hypothetical protein